MDEGVASAADPSVVEAAVPETDATKVAEENAVAKTERHKKEVAAI